MSDEQRQQIQHQQQQQQRRRNCCRLCLAPDNECISILNSYAADKEPLATKIQTCVSVKISINDSLSLRICHACISYLNSWQSFKNRCLSAQNKQRSWIEGTSTAVALQKTIQSAEHHHTADNHYDDQHQQQQQQQQDEQQSLASSILEGISTLKKRKSLTVYVSPKSQQNKSQQETNKQQKSVTSDVVVPFKTKRHYTKHKHATQRRQISQTQTSASLSTTTTATTSSSGSKSKQKSEKKQIMQQQQQLITAQQSFIIPVVPTTVAATIAATLTTTTTTATTTSCTNTTTTTTCATSTVTTLTDTPTISCSSSDVTTSAAAVISGSSGVAGDECLVGGGTLASTSSAACSSAVQQLRLFRRYSYNPLPAVQIKDEPLELDEDYNNAKQHHDESDENMVDASMFLERNADEGDFMESTSNYDYETMKLDLKPLPASTTIRMSTKEAACRACNLKFSTRANARRHEKNLHPQLFGTLEENDQTVNKQTAALNASLELQRAVAAAVAADACKLSSGATISPQKYRQEVVNAFNNSELSFDYENPEKYQELLTDEKIVFIQQNDEFLRQYQTMTCRCCNKFYTTYKNFMAHMRKKYLTLPRNCCFNCLKLNDSKALFISHLKRRNCINLHRVLHSLMAKNANFAAAVTATVAAAPEKMRAKELLVNKMYECKLCPKTFRMKLEFRSHVYEEHADVQRKDVSSTQCCYCAMDIEDPAERKRHYNNMECIVMLRCVTCDSKYDSQQKFMEHVQEKHLANFGEPKLLPGGGVDNSPGKITSSMGGGMAGASSADESRSGYFNVSLINTTPKAQYFSRMPQACPICGQQYNNYNNVLRHMESKHPDQLPQTYKCVKCGLGYPRLSNLREHMVSAHGADKARHTGFEYIVNADAVKAATGTTTQTQNPYTGRYDYVMKDLMSITNGGTVAEDDCDSENAAKKMRMDMSMNNNNNNGNPSTMATPRECPICNAVFGNNIGLSNHMRSHQSSQNNNFGMAATKLMTAGSVTQTPMLTGGQQQMLKKSFEQSSDRRFRRMRCRICQRRFSSKKSYRHHMLNDHQIRNVQFIKCKLCDAEFAYEKGLKVHMFKIHNTLLKDDMIIKQYECEICSIVYRTDVELQHHLANVHNKQGDDPSNMDDDDYNADESNAPGMAAVDNSSVGADLSGISTPVSGVGLASDGPLYWYQCKYCPSNFNTNKKLAIHINSHDEFDSNDYSCKDCGNVYSGRKSLWVHRYKKHPQIPEPSECVMCKKMFFDAQMLQNHIPSCNRKPIVQSAVESTAAVYKHKTGDDDDDDEDDQSRDAADTANAHHPSTKSSTGGKIKLPEVACTLCGARFTDQELFAKHIQMHEKELYTDNPLAAMFDTGPADPNQFYMDRINDNGEYACDLCAKTFSQMTALKVHRKWHFRGDSKQNEADQHIANSNRQSLQPQQQHHNKPQPQQQQQHQMQQKHPNQQMPISHQHLLGLQAVGLMPRQFATMAVNHKPAQKRKRELKCQYCPSTFISNNNLRRHLYELHKNEMGNLPEPPKIDCDVPNACRKCNVKFETKAEWIEHKVAEARVMKPFGPFQWGCDLCGAYVSRKEKLINHLHNHMKDQVILPVDQLDIKPAQPQLQQQNPAQQHQPQEEQGVALAEMPGFKKIKLPTLPQVQTAQQMQQDEEEESRDSVKDEYDEGDDDDEEEQEEEEAEEEVEVENHIEQPAAEEFDEDEEQIEQEFDDLAVGAQQTVGGEEEVDEDDDDDDDDDDEAEDDDDDGDDEDPSTNEDTNEASSLKAPQPLQITQPRSSNDTEADDDDDDEDDDDDSDEFDDDDDNSSTENRKPSSALNNAVPSAAVKSRFSCDLCHQVYFDTQQELQKHVKLHFLNGPGSVTLTEIKTSKSSSNKSRSSSSDVVTA